MTRPDMSLGNTRSMGARANSSRPEPSQQSPTPEQKMSTTPEPEAIREQVMLMSFGVRTAVGGAEPEPFPDSRKAYCVREALLHRLFEALRAALPTEEPKP